MQEYVFSPKNLYYRKNKFKPDRPTLVFVHGLSGSSSAWFLYEKKFEERYNVLTFDLRGHGNSEKPKNFEDYAIRKFSEDLFELASHLQISRFVLISHSFGVLVAFDFMAEHLDMVEKAVFLSPNFAPRRIPSGKILEPFLGLAGWLRILPFNQAGKGRVDYSRFINTGDWNIPRSFADVSNTGLRPYLYCTRQSYEVDYEKLLEQINVPTLIMHGRKDSIFPVSGSLVMREKIKNSRLAIIENSDHILVLNNFPEVSGAIAEFVSGR